MTHSTMHKERLHELGNKVSPASKANNSGRGRAPPNSGTEAKTRTEMICRKYSPGKVYVELARGG